MRSVNLNNYIGLIVNEKEDRYGQVCRVTKVDDSTPWVYFEVEFADGTEDHFINRLVEGQPDYQIRRFYRHDNDAGKWQDTQGTGGPEKFISKYLDEQMGSIKEMMNDYQKLFGEEFNIPERVIEDNLWKPFRNIFNLKMTEKPKSLINKSDKFPN